MSFARPEILWALFALLIPIIVHLFNFRRFRKVTFSNVSFLKEVQQETKSRSKIKHFLILFARLIALACLILAFAQPFIPLDENNKTQGDRAISIYIDNSFSMEGESEEGQLLEVAKNKARELLSAYGPTDRFQIITNDFEGRHQRLVSKEEAKELIDEIQVSAQVRQLEDVISRQNDLLKSNELEGERLSFLLSDLQKNTHELSADFKADSLINVRFVPQLSAIDVNVYIDSVWFDTPVRVLNQPEVLHLRVKHNSDEVLENIPLQLNINGAKKAIGSFKLVPGLATDTSLTFTQTTAGNQFASLSIEDYPVTFDDEFFFSYNVASQINILDIKGKSAGSNVEKVFANDPFYAYSSMSEGQVNYGELGTYQLLILNQLDDLSSGLVNELE
ncbi:MAG: BatA and WFA domain-containing protein, partial [Flavobacteriales bacterium]|nr:BatA and WFA domain-containing protein [Flavobacteriales bacterium]